MTSLMHGDTSVSGVTDRAQLALEAYRTEGTWEKAAIAAGFTNKGTAYRAAMNLLGKRVDATVHDLRAEANARHAAKIAMLEDIIYDLERPLNDRLRAVGEHTRAEARHARFNGLDAPVQVQVSSGAEARLRDVLADAKATVMGLVLDSQSRPDENEEA